MARSDVQAKPKNTLGREVLTGLVGPLVVGVVVLLGQAFLQPKIAKEVKREETILEQRYAACNDAFNALLRRVERASVVKGEVRYKPVPTQEKLTAIDINAISCRLALFGSNGSVAKTFADLMDAKSLKIRDIAEFVLTLREEMGIKGEGIKPTEFRFAYPTEEITTQ